MTLVRGFLCLACLLALGTGLPAQPRGRPPAHLVNPELRDEEEGARVLERFRQLGLEGDYAVLISLRHSERGAPDFILRGRLWGTWRAGVPWTRLRAEPLSGLGEEAVDLLAHNGPEARLWMWGGIADADGTTDERGNLPLEAGDIHRSLWHPVLATPFDLQMPFLYWNDWIYEGSERVKGRPAYNFILYPPPSFDGSAGIAAVRVSLDAHFNAMLRAQTLDEVGRPLKSFQVLGFRKVDGQWMVRTIDIVDERTRAKTRFEVQAVALRLELPDLLFQPFPLGQRLPLPPLENMTWLE